MSDNEIIALRERMTGYGKKPLIVELHQLADEALARRAALECMRDEAAYEYNRLRERVAQLETALREAMDITDDPSTGHAIGRLDAWRAQARTALATTSR